MRAWALRLLAAAVGGALLLFNLVAFQTYQPGEDFRDACVRALREKAAESPEAGQAAEFLQTHPRVRVLPVPPAFIKRANHQRRWSSVRGMYLHENRTVVLAETQATPFVSKDGFVLSWDELRPQLESALPILIHEVEHARAADELGFAPGGLFEYELDGFAAQRAYLRRALVLTPSLARVGRAKLLTSTLGMDRVLKDADRCLDLKDPKAAACRTFDAWGYWSDAEKKLGDDLVAEAMIAAATPRQLCDALKRPEWYGADAVVSGSAAISRLSWARDPWHLARARAYFRARLPEYSDCLRSRPKS